MAHYRSHFSFSIFLALAYLGGGALYYNVSYETLGICFIVIFICGLLPDIDSGAASSPGKDLSGLLALFPALLLIEHVEFIRNGGISRMVLVTVVTFFFSRLVLRELVDNFTRRRGMLHSMPMALISAEIVYLLLQDLPHPDRLFTSAGAFVGYTGHLLLDSTSRVDNSGSEISSDVRNRGVIKLFGKSPVSTVLAYSTVLLLGVWVASDYNVKLQGYKNRVVAMVIGSSGGN